MPIDVFSSGNHIWDKKEIYDTLNRVRPAPAAGQLPAGQSGAGLDGADDGRRAFRSAC